MLTAVHFSHSVPPWWGPGGAFLSAFLTRIFISVLANVSFPRPIHSFRSAGQRPRDDRYQFNISASGLGTYSFRTCGSVGDPYLAIYQDDGTGNLVRIVDCDDSTL